MTMLEEAELKVVEIERLEELMEMVKAEILYERKSLNKRMNRDIENGFEFIYNKNVYGYGYDGMKPDNRVEIYGSRIQYLWDYERNVNNKIVMLRKEEKELREAYAVRGKTVGEEVGIL